MEENNNSKEQEKNDVELKKQATETLKETKEQIKNINIKEEAEKGKGLLSKLFKNPISTIKEIVKDDKNQFYKIALIIVITWVLLVLFNRIIDFFVYEYRKINILLTIKLMLAPILKILAMSIIINLLIKENKQPLTKAITLVSIAKIPVVISVALEYLTYISLNIKYITNPISSLLNIVSTILMFFVVKEMFEEKDNENALKIFIKVEVIYYIVVFAFSFLGISL